VEPNNAKALYANAVSLERMGRYREALERYQRLARVCSSALCQDTLTNTGIIHFKLGRPEQALQALRAARDLAPARSRPQALLVSYFNDTEQYQQALEQYQRALRQAGPSAALHLYHGVTLQKLGRQAEALRFYGEAIAADPENALAYKARGLLLGKSAQHRARAVSDLRKYLELDRSDPTRSRVEAVLAQWTAELQRSAR